MSAYHIMWFLEIQVSLSGFHVLSHISVNYFCICVLMNACICAADNML